MPPRGHGRGRRRAAFTLLELVIAMIVMAVGLLAIQGLMVRQSRQVSHVEQWCRTDRTYYAVSQTNTWMKAVGAPAALNDTVGQPAWEPPVTGHKSYDPMLNSLTRTPDGSQLTASVTLYSK